MADEKKVTLSIDGKPVTVPAGTLVIEAAKQVNVDVPRYCYHPALGNPGNCRLCVVEVEGMPKLQVSCRLRAAEGMVVKTASPNAKRAQASSLELHLVNHPLDCPVCDQAGECWLQDYYMKIGLYHSAVKEDKHHKGKRIPIGQHVMLDQERCILCTRCTRFVDNVTKTHELGIFNRGDREVLAPLPGMTVDNGYSGNLHDICPVGALTDRDFRFRARVWYLKSTPSVCDGCARGCAIEVHTNTRLWHTKGERVARFKPRLNPEVNGYWMCDEGRYSYPRHDKARYGKFRRKEGAGWRQLEWEPGLKALSDELREKIAAKGAAGLAVVLSGRLSNEDFYMARRLFAETLKAGHIVFGPAPEQLGGEDKLLKRKEKVPNLRGAQALGFGSKVKESSWDAVRKGIESGAVWGLYVVDRDPSKVWGAETLDALLGRLSFSAFQGANACAYSERADWILPAATYVEKDGTFTNFQGRVQRFYKAAEPIGQSRPDWAIWRDLLSYWEAHVPFQEASQVFDLLTEHEAPFAGLNWNMLGPNGAPLKDAEAVKA